MFLSRLKKKFKKPKKVESLTVLTDKCVGCGVCVTKCKREVFTIDKELHHAVVTNLSQCVGCGKCVTKMCKFNAIELKLSISNEK